MADTVNFRFELHDTLIDECLSTCELWNKYMEANKNAINRSPFEMFMVGT